METGIKVGDIMTRNPICVSPEANLLDCAKTMIKKRVGALIIKKKNEKLEGILTEKDLIWVLTKKSRKDFSEILAKDIMKRKVVTIKPSKDIADAMRMFKKKKVRRLPVVENGKLIGLITIKDIIKIDPGLIQLIVESVKIKDETEKLASNEEFGEEGICETCGSYGVLLDFKGKYICEDCADSK